MTQQDAPRAAINAKPQSPNPQDPQSPQAPSGKPGTGAGEGQDKLNPKGQPQSSGKNQNDKPHSPAQDRDPNESTSSAKSKIVIKPASESSSTASQATDSIDNKGATVSKTTAEDTGASKPKPSVEAKHNTIIINPTSEEK